ncbi:MAG: haloacid dehalogenase type II [Dehalococcoidia bacterium]|nr:haloacid dehalogenase type II [Dehalococcoidia bacterium]
MIEGNGDPDLRALALDAYGTLFDVHSVIAACEVAFPSRGEALSQLWRAKQLEYTWLLSLMGRHEDFWAVTDKALSFACHSLGLSCDTATHTRLLEGYYHLSAYPEVPAVLARLAASHKLVILSNGTPRMLAAVADSAGLTEVFNELISVEAVGVFKPSPRVYGLLPQRLGLPLEAIGFVSSNAFDITGAKAFGLWTCWANRQDTAPDGLGYAPDVTVRTLSGLADRLAPGTA